MSYEFSNKPSNRTVYDSYSGGHLNSKNSDRANTSLEKRYIAAAKISDTLKTEVELAEYNTSYHKGKMRLALANKYLKLIEAGQDRFVEEGTKVVWAKEGNDIYRIESDLSWVDEFLQNEEV